MTDSTAPLSTPKPRAYGAINTLGLWTLYKREVGRFLKVWMQTLFAPVITTLLFMTVFKLAFGTRGAPEGEVLKILGADFYNFLAPGLIVMSMLQNAFQNSSSSLTISKVQGSQVDFLMPPLSPLELTVAFIAGAMTRGLMVGVIGALAIHFSGLATLHIVNIVPVIWFSLAATMFLAAIGAMGGIWADKFDHLAAVTNFVIVPLTFLSGTFYDINVLSEPFRSIAYFDPIFFMIDGFRAGFIGASNTDLGLGMAVTGFVAFAASAGVWWMFKSGYKLKS
ncbi:MAG: ABC transporter permease [Alphaproteobacteria bacterium]|nr:ABC transporter permease [Alphaproteobacteria bacterium]